MPTDCFTNAQLLAGLKSGDRKIFNYIYEQYWESLFIHAYKRVNSNVLAEEMVQELFINLWDKRFTISIEKSLEAYLFGCMKNQVMLFFRKKYMQAEHQYEIASRQPYIDSQLERRVVQRDLLNMIELLIQRLPQKSRNVFELSRKQYLSNKEIAQLLNISNKTVEYHIDYALKYLREHCSEYLIVALLLISSAFLLI